jgi:phosphoglycolate phosphatase
MKKYKAIIFDFDGTLVNSLDILIRVYFSLKEEMGLPDINQKDVERMRGMGIRQIISFLSLSYLKLPFYLFKVKEKFKDFMTDISPVNGMAFVLIELSKKYPLHILSSNDQNIVFSVLNRFQINCFETVTSEINVFGKDYALEKAISQLGYSNHEVLYVGDEIRDVLACQKIKMDCCAVSWGLNSNEVLKTKAPTYLISEPDELLKLL